ncbi:TIGR02253 family HAD-type hydrolase [Candidatus Woesearchaeota archaeon]|nr:TIGR02253 family HAD-type hydrolase [Candidatus Woesearchaeota archaeon]MBI2660784.1 TIGR02253 family HAD-type hydrolase [Candidatus Woesearchaeota archaeon]
MIKAVIFDLDNTLIDFMKMKKISCEAAVDAMIDAGLNADKENAMKVLFGLYDKHGYEDSTIFQKFLLQLTGKVDYRILANGIVAYRKVRGGFLEPYPHVNYVLFKLKDMKIKLAILSDAPKLKAWIRLAAMKLTDFFDVVVALDDTNKLKPHRLPFEKAIEMLDVKPEECLMVGDRPERDIAGAKAVGMKTCFARYGYKEASNTGADFEIGDIKDLLKIINNETPQA